MWWSVIAVFFITTSHGIRGQVPDVEFRNLWIATVDNIDWPSVPGLSTSAQLQELNVYLDLLAETNFNSIIFQVRPVGDAFYNSTIEPWTKYMTGTQGVAPDPYYDPLEYVTSGAHLRGMEVHAWLNPYRANYAPNWDGLHPSHMAMQMIQYAYPYSDYLWMDPGVSEVEDQFINVVTDILSRYDVDGIHFDDYFYPYPEDNVPFPDNATYERYLAGGGHLSLADWRRDNVNGMIQRVYSVAQSFSKKLSISPFGLYRPGHEDGMPSPIEGFDPYEGQYADSKFWLQQGWLDMFLPQIYWEIEPPEQSYPIILDWWLSQNTLNKHVYAGNALYKADPTRGDWDLTEIRDQVDISRDPTNRDRGSLGNSMFGAKYFRDDLKGVVEFFKTEIYPNNATIPPLNA